MQPDYPWTRDRPIASSKRRLFWFDRGEASDRAGQETRSELVTDSQDLGIEVLDSIRLSWNWMRRTKPLEGKRARRAFAVIQNRPRAHQFSAQLQFALERQRSVAPARFCSRALKGSCRTKVYRTTAKRAQACNA